MEFPKALPGLAIVTLVSVISVALPSQAYASDYPDYVVEDGADLFIEECAAADFTVTIDGTEYSPGDVALGFSLSSNYSVSAGDGVTVGWVYESVIQGSFGHGLARELAGELGEEENGVWEGGDATVSANSGVWDSGLNSAYEYAFYPSVFYAACPGTDRLAYIQTFPGLTLDQVGYAANIDEGVFVDDEATLSSTGLGPANNSSLVFAPLSNFRNPAYAFWAMYIEDEVYGNPDVAFDFGTPLEGDFVQGVWAWAGWLTGEGYEEFASSFYSYSTGSDLTEVPISEDVSAEAPSSSPASREEVQGDPGIFLTVTGGAGSLFEGRTVIYGSYAVAPNSAYKLTVQSIPNPWRETRVLASGVVNGGGHLEATTMLPRMGADNYRIVFEGVAANGQPLKLTNHVNVNAAGRFTSISAERLQPYLP